MADYWGLEAISARMGMHHDTLMRLYDHQRFLMFKRRRAVRKGAHPRMTWYTNDELITRWETAQCAAQWRERKARQGAKKPKVAVDECHDTRATVGA